MAGRKPVVEPTPEPEQTTIPIEVTVKPEIQAARDEIAALTAPAEDGETAVDPADVIAALVADNQTAIAQIEKAIADNSGLTLAFRDGMGGDIVIPLPARKPGETELVLNGAIKMDPMGRVDVWNGGYEFRWENPNDRPAPMNRCTVTGDGCPHAHKDFGMCVNCPGIARERLIEAGILTEDETDGAAER